MPSSRVLIGWLSGRCAGAPGCRVGGGCGVRTVCGEDVAAGCVWVFSLVSLMGMCGARYVFLRCLYSVEFSRAF